MIMNLDPQGFGFGGDENKLIKYYPVYGTLFIAFVTWINGVYIKNNVWPLLQIYFILVFSFWLLFESCTKVIDGSALADTFLGRGLSGFMLLSAFFLLSNKYVYKQYLKVFAWCIVSSGFIIATLQLVWATGYHFIVRAHIFHEEVFLVYAAACIIYFSKVNVTSKLITILFLSVGALSQFKNTSFLMFALFLLIVFGSMVAGISTMKGKGLVIKGMLISTFLIIILFMGGEHQNEMGY